MEFISEIRDFPELTFEEKRHQYRLDGVTIPSVSEIMTPLSTAQYKEVDPEILSKAAHRGTAVHTAIETYVKFGMVDIEPEYEWYFKAFQRWEQDTRPVAIGSECRVYHRLFRYAGTADLPVKFGNKRVLVDVKTSATVNKMLTGVQLEAYSMAFDSQFIHFDGKAILHLQKDGNYQWVYYNRDDLESRETFGALLQIYHHIQKYRKDA